MNLIESRANNKHIIADLGVYFSSPLLAKEVAKIFLKKPEKASPFLELYATVTIVARDYTNALNILGEEHDEILFSYLDIYDYESVALFYAQKVYSNKKNTFKRIYSSLEKMKALIKADKYSNIRYGISCEDIESLLSSLDNKDDIAVIPVILERLEAALEKKPTYKVEVSKLVCMINNSYDYLSSIAESTKKELFKFLGFEETFFMLCNRLISEDD